MKKLLILVLIISIVLMIGCTVENIVSNSEIHKHNEITIVTYNDTYKKYPVLQGYIDKFQLETGIKVKIDAIEANTYDDYIKKLNTKLYFKKGPTLILFSESENYSKYIDNGVALNVKGRINNYKKIYNSLKYKDSFVPIGMTYVATILNKNLLEELGMKEPNFNWTNKEYLHIKKKWLEEEPRYFNITEYKDIVVNPLNRLEIIDKDKKIVTLNNLKVKNVIKDAQKKIFSDNYIINSKYSYMDYYEMFFDYDSDKYLKSMRKDYHYENRNKVLKYRFGINGLKTLVTSTKMKKENLLILPRIDKDIGLKTWGFIVNKNGKNVEIGMKFLDGLLSDEVQLLMFNFSTYGGYPVNKNIEDKISKIERKNNVSKKAIELRKYILKKIKAGIYKPYRQIDSVKYEFQLMLHKDLMKLIFTDKLYTDEELSMELQKLENKYNIWLNE
ncbi:extracellular solute-binding protein [Thermohalobacter berrensis]|uniref:Sugar ABC transporter substrate-binding protein n=1 Tax=Thermohalobacter berrensis TaxID=99594 RepID=A0A419T3D0_9FIRM|nr:extracellular solute-binding protein [Thermohalobacter berrensis]RKD31955.1 hypothetical protein BET03_11790 [Thermohalobacter berrensis]